MNVHVWINKSDISDLAKGRLVEFSNLYKPDYVQVSISPDMYIQLCDYLDAIVDRRALMDFYTNGSRDHYGDVYEDEY
jgi:hypothetical protein